MVLVAVQCKDFNVNKLFVCFLTDRLIPEVLWSVLLTVCGDWKASILGDILDVTLHILVSLSECPATWNGSVQPARGLSAKQCVINSQVTHLLHCLIILIHLNINYFYM